MGSGIKTITLRNTRTSGQNTSTSARIKVHILPRANHISIIKLIKLIRATKITKIIITIVMRGPKPMITVMII